MSRAAYNKRVPPALTTFAPGNTARGASRVGTLERYPHTRGREVVGPPMVKSQGLTRWCSTGDGGVTGRRGRARMRAAETGTK